MRGRFQIAAELGNLSVRFQTPFASASRRGHTGQKVLRKSRPENQRIKMGSGVTERIGFPAPPGGNGRQLQLFAQKMATETREERNKGRAFQEAGTERIRNRDIPSPRRVHKTGHAEKGIAAQFEWIAE